MAETWVTTALHRLRATTECPGCAAPLTSATCAWCGIDLDGAPGTALLTASQAAADALARRERELDTLRHNASMRQGTPRHEAPIRYGNSARDMPTATAGSLPPPTTPAPPPPPQRTKATVGLQQVLAPLAAGLLAVAAVVIVFFTFAENLTLRAAVTGLLALATAIAAPLLRRSGLTATGESVAVLTVALALIDCELFLTLRGPDEHTTTWRAACYVVLALGLLAGARATRLLGWAACAVPLLPVAMALAGFANGPRGGSWTQTAGHFSIVLLATALTTTHADRLGTWSARGALPRWERALLTIARATAFTLAVLVTLTIPTTDTVSATILTTLLLLGAGACAALFARCHTTRGWWWATGAMAVCAPAAAGWVDGPWTIAIVPLGGLAGWLLTLGAARRFLDPRDRVRVLSGATTVQCALSVPAILATMMSAIKLLGTVIGGASAPHFDTDIAQPALVGVATALLMTSVSARLRWRTPRRQWVPAPGLHPDAAPPDAQWGYHVLEASPRFVTAGRTGAPFLATVLLLGVAAYPRYLPVTALVVPVALAAAALIALIAPPRLLGALARRFAVAAFGRAERRAWRSATTTSLFLAIAIAGLASWLTRPDTLVGGALVVLLLLASRRVCPPGVQPLLVVVSLCYALTIVGVGLSWTDLDAVAIVCLVSSAASTVALVCTVLPRIDRATWWAVLGTTSVPFLLGVGTLLTTRTWWSAGAATVMLALEVVLVGTRRQGNTRVLRAAAALALLPTASVLVISAGAMLTTGTSASPRIVPLVAALTTVALLGAAPVADHVESRAPGTRTWIRAAIEVSALLNGTITVLLAATRPAGGADLVIATLAILAAGASALAGRADRRWSWWIAGGLWVGALWTALGSRGVQVIEAYTLAPGLAAIVVGMLLARRASRWWALALSGAALATVPSVIALALTDARDTGETTQSIRLWALVAAGLLAVAAAEALRRGHSRWARDLSMVVDVVAFSASVGGLIQSMVIAGSGTPHDVALFWTAWGWTIGAALLAAVAGRQVASAAPVASDGATATGVPLFARWTSRWSLGPALAVLATGSAVTVRDDRVAALSLWVLMMALLVLTAFSVRRMLEARSDLPPTWFVWLAALAVGYAGWLPQELLRAEVFSLPLGFGLLSAGYLGFRAGPGRGGTSWGRWPLGAVRSWSALGPGLLAVLAPLVVATHRDPETWRAVLVVVLALSFVLIGTQRHLAAPFVLGIAVLPIEVLVVFVSQLDTSIDASSWGITVGAAGGLLLIIVAQYERRIVKFGGTAAYVRDLR